MGNCVCTRGSAIEINKPGSACGASLAQNLRLGYRRETNRSLCDIYDIQTEGALGMGVHGPVYRAIHKETKVQYAMKTLSVDDAKSEEEIEEMRKEIMINSTLDHSNIAKLVEVFSTPKAMHLLIELCAGGELLDRLQESGPYDEDKARAQIKQMVNAVRYLHSGSIAHCDLKLENWIYVHEGEDAQLKLIDFGLSQKINKEKGEKLRGALGTQFYIAPEMIMNDETFDERCDMWALGVIAYMCICGRPPFWGKDFSDTLTIIKTGKFVFAPEISNELSAEAKDFISKLLTVDPEKRLTAVEAQNHPWLAPLKQKTEPVSITVLESLRQFPTLSTLQRTVMQIVAFQSTDRSLDKMQDEFKKLDEQEIGFFDKQQLKKALIQHHSNILEDEEIERIFASMDFGHTGKVHWHEFLAASLNYSKVEEIDLIKAFKRLDCDASGSITLKSLKEMTGGDLSLEECERVIADTDSKNSGSIDFDDFMNSNLRMNEQVVVIV